MIYAVPGAVGIKVQYKVRHDNLIGGEFVLPVKHQYFNVSKFISDGVYVQTAGLDTIAGTRVETSTTEHSNILLKKPPRGPVGVFQKIVAAMGLGLAFISSGALAQQQFINVLTGGQSGVYYPVGVAISQIYAKDIPNTRATAQVTKASVENLNLLQAGRGEIALTLADSLSDAWQGNAEVGFTRKLDKLRGISATYNNYVQIVASADSGIKTIADLKGKRLSVGAAKSGTELNARAILKAAGLEYKDLAKVEYLPFAESVELMKNRQIDATLQSAGLGVASIRDLATAIKIVVVPVPADVIAKISDPAYQPAVIPANTYGGQTTDVPAVAIANFLVTHNGVSEDLAYQMTKSLYANIDTLYAAHNSIKVMKRENAIKGMPVPLHPGAERYYREVGLIK